MVFVPTFAMQFYRASANDSAFLANNALLAEPLTEETVGVLEPFATACKIVGESSGEAIHGSWRTAMRAIEKGDVSTGVKAQQEMGLAVALAPNMVLRDAHNIVKTGVRPRSNPFNWSQKLRDQVGKALKPQPYVSEKKWGRKVALGEEEIIWTLYRHRLINVKAANELDVNKIALANRVRTMQNELLEDTKRMAACEEKTKERLERELQALSLYDVCEAMTVAKRPITKTYKLLEFHQREFRIAQAIIMGGYLLAKTGVLTQERAEELLGILHAFDSEERRGAVTLAKVKEDYPYGNQFFTMTQILSVLYAYNGSPDQLRHWPVHDLVMSWRYYDDIADFRKMLYLPSFLVEQAWRTI